MVSDLERFPGDGERREVIDGSCWCRRSRLSTTRHLVATVLESDVLTTPVRPGFEYPSSRLFAGMPTE
jgi:hypothetical protein